MRWRTSKVGSVLAGLHLLVVSLLVLLISVNPGHDWPWWGAVPFVLDLPLSFLVDRLSDGIVNAVMALPHGAFESWLLTLREPFSSFALFWLPAILYLSLGTLWHYYWPQALSFVFRKLGPRSPAPS
jgi:hypothetical protein